MNKENVQGDIVVSEDVIGSIANLAALEVDGVVQLNSGFTAGLVEKFGKKNAGRGVKVVRNEEELIIDLSIIVEFGVEVPKVAERVQKKVKGSVEVMTGLRVIQVNVNVDGVRLNHKEE